MGTAITIQAQARDGQLADYLQFQFHTVKKGETITTIARKYDITTTVLRDSNDLSRTARVKAKQTLAIPPRPARALPSASTTRPTPAATTASTARATGSSPVVYRVRAGDTLFSIARQFDTTVDAIKRLNSLSSDRIALGDDSPCAANDQKRGPHGHERTKATKATKATKDFRKISVRESFDFVLRVSRESFMSSSDFVFRFEDTAFDVVSEEGTQNLRSQRACRVAVSARLRVN